MKGDEKKFKEDVYTYECSQCGRFAYGKKTDKCPQCGRFVKLRKVFHHRW